jgi:hypothetical protein
MSMLRLLVAALCASLALSGCNCGSQERLDAGPPPDDAGAPDAGDPDAARPDAGQADSSEPDAGAGLDAGSCDAGVIRSALVLTTSSTTLAGSTEATDTGVFRIRGPNGQALDGLLPTTSTGAYSTLVTDCRATWARGCREPLP